MTRSTADAPRSIGAAAAPACDPAAPGGCAICADEALQARVVTVDPGTNTAEVLVLDRGAGGTAAGALRAVALDLVDDVAVADLVLVHQGFVISRIEAP